jgi:3-phenylpropionate/trans-cinnamate dioxygenase ferredoxin reductase component
LKPPAWYRENDVLLRTGVPATGLRRRPDAGWEVALGDGSVVQGHDVVVATGARPLLLSGPAFAGAPDRPRYLRDLADAGALRERLRRGPGRLVVAGAGFIGLEVAGAAARLGWNVTVLDLAAGPLQRVLPASVAGLCLRTRPEDAVRIECGVAVAGLVDGAVVLSDGRELPADCVVAGIGVRPNTEWLRGAGLEEDGGIVCDGQGRTSLAGVWAVGDVARWPNASTGLRVRVEQWQAAKEQGRVTAAALLGGDATWDTPPYFWTDLFGQRVQMVGHSDPDMDVHIAQDGRKAIALMGRSDLHGVVAVNAPRWAALGKRWLAQRISFAEARERAGDQVAGARDHRPAHPGLTA